jgi:hypothetical protein
MIRSQSILNVRSRINFKCGDSALIRFVKTGATTFTDKKVRNGVDVLVYIRQGITNPVLTILD